MTGGRNLRVAIRDRGGVLVVHLKGVLDQTSYSWLLEVLLSCATMEPAGIVVDVDELSVDLAARLVVFDVAWLFTRRLPAVQLMLVSSDEGEPPRRVPSFRTTAAALAAIARSRSDGRRGEPGRACPA